MLRDQSKCQTAIMVEANTQREIVIVHLNSRNSIVCLHTLSPCRPLNRLSATCKIQKKKTSILLAIKPKPYKPSGRVAAAATALILCAYSTAFGMLVACKPVSFSFQEPGQG